MSKTERNGVSVLGVTSAGTRVTVLQVSLHGAGEFHHRTGGNAEVGYFPFDRGCSFPFQISSVFQFPQGWKKRINVIRGQIVRRIKPFQNGFLAKNKTAFRTTGPPWVYDNSAHI